MDTNGVNKGKLTVDDVRAWYEARLEQVHPNTPDEMVRPRLRRVGVLIEEIDRQADELEESKRARAEHVAGLDATIERLRGIRPVPEPEIITAIRDAYRNSQPGAEGRKVTLTMPWQQQIEMLLLEVDRLNTLPMGELTILEVPMWFGGGNRHAPGSPEWVPPYEPGEVYVTATGLLAVMPEKDSPAGAQVFPPYDRELEKVLRYGYHALRQQADREKHRESFERTIDGIRASLGRGVEYPGDLSTEALHRRDKRMLLAEIDRLDQLGRDRAETEAMVTDAGKVVVTWDVQDGGVLGAIIVCTECHGRKRVVVDGVEGPCEQCDGDGALHRPYDFEAYKASLTMAPGEARPDHIELVAAIRAAHQGEDTEIRLGVERDQIATLLDEIDRLHADETWTAMRLELEAERDQWRAKFIELDGRLRGSAQLDNDEVQELYESMPKVAAERDAFASELRRLRTAALATEPAMVAEIRRAYRHGTPDREGPDHFVSIPSGQQVTTLLDHIDSLHNDVAIALAKGEEAWRNGFESGEASGRKDASTARMLEGQELEAVADPRLDEVIEQGQALGQQLGILAARQHAAARALVEGFASTYTPGTERYEAIKARLEEALDEGVSSWVPDGAAEADEIAGLLAQVADLQATAQALSLDVTYAHHGDLLKIAESGVPFWTIKPSNELRKHDLVAVAGDLPMEVTYQEVNEDADPETGRYTYNRTGAASNGYAWHRTPATPDEPVVVLVPKVNRDPVPVHEATGPIQIVPLDAEGNAAGPPVEFGVTTGPVSETAPSGGIVSERTLAILGGGKPIVASALPESMQRMIADAGRLAHEHAVDLAIHGETTLRIPPAAVPMDGEPVPSIETDAAPEFDPEVGTAAALLAAYESLPAPTVADEDAPWPLVSPSGTEYRDVAGEYEPAEDHPDGRPRLARVTWEEVDPAGGEGRTVGAPPDFPVPLVMRPIGLPVSGDAAGLLDAYQQIEDVGAGFEDWTLWTPEGEMIRMVSGIRSRTAETGYGEVVAIEWTVRAGAEQTLVENYRVPPERPVNWVVGARPTDAFDGPVHVPGTVDEIVADATVSFEDFTEPWAEDSDPSFTMFSHVARADLCPDGPPSVAERALSFTGDVLSYLRDKWAELELGWPHDPNPMSTFRPTSEIRNEIPPGEVGGVLFHVGHETEGRPLTPAEATKMLAIASGTLLGVTEVMTPDQARDALRKIERFMAEQRRPGHELAPYMEAVNTICRHHGDRNTFPIGVETRRSLPTYVYVASSWRNEMQPAVVATLRAAGIDCYDFRDPHGDGAGGFSWKDVRDEPLDPTACVCGHPADDHLGEADGCMHYDLTPNKPEGGMRRTYCTCGGYDQRIAAKGSDWVPADEYLRMIEHPAALDGFAKDLAAMERADVFVLVLPCGKSAHLEAGWAMGAGKRVVILLEDPVEPELMYRTTFESGGAIVTDVMGLLGALGVED